ncbi:dienelactone hydrolase family protein [Streptomyces sp. 7-21]|uniref:alpha/beta hydrolase family protein n=1 Tax=Streptomyces sp. 7-21 TaxID=2802283 RepID=UPI00191FAA6F|nr:dienelactone hydrolase family protein [Streptomyces sp. 7-21]MBL1065402.1 dienelactone hydrolase family protein [Streptomyces sp. 7-21]
MTELISASPVRRAARRLGVLSVAAALVGGLLSGAAARADTASCQRGPDPTPESITEDGPYDVGEYEVRLATGFGGGTVYYPTATGEGTFGAVAIAPGYTASQTSMAWYGPRLASHGFVVFTIDTLSRLDQPSSRGRQLLAALEYLTEDSRVADRIDPGRLAVMGHSMGGGGALEAAESDPSLRAAIPLTGWNLDKDFSGVEVPTLVIGAENDSIAPVRTHSEPFYESLPGTGGKAYLELAGASHFAPNLPNDTISAYTVSWLKRFVDDDTRYEEFLCPGPVADRAVSEYRETCPF